MDIGNVFVISAPSGVGKSTLIRLLLESVPRLRFAVSHTTRERRWGEKDGQEYFFVTRARFEKMAASDRFVEWADIHGNLYGTSRRLLNQARRGGWDVILDIDVQGQKQVGKQFPDAIKIFILLPSFRELKKRLQNRGTDSKREMEVRLGKAAQELARWKEYDYLVFNEELHSAFEQLRAIVMAARARRARVSREAVKILKTFGG